MKRLHAILILSAGLLAASAPGADARIWPFKGKKKAETAQQDTVKKKPTPYEKLLGKGTETAKGFLTLHLKSGKVYLEVPDSVLGKELILGATVTSTSDNGAGPVGTKRGLKHFTIVKEGRKLQFRELNVSYMDGGPSVAKSSIGPIFKNLKIEAAAPDSSAVVDVTDLFLSDDKEFSPFTGYSTYDSYKHDEQFRKEYSYIRGIKAFEDNVSVTSSLSYVYTVTTANGRKLIDKKPFTAEMTYSVLRLSDRPYHPRTADPRIGFFFTQRERLGDTGTSPKDVWFVNRWRMEPSDTAAWLRGEKVDPVKPIVFYIDSGFPAWWKPYIRKAVASWCKPFERIGFSNAVIAKDFPTPEEDPQFDPDNIKYSCIRYAPVGIRNAMGPSWVDPRSGEIINASVYVYHDVIRLLSEWMLVQTGQADPAVRTMDIPKEKLGDALEYVIRHEVGHCLGLMHNMGASSCIPVECLRDPAFTRENGTTYSIMDYARFNYIASEEDAARGVKLTPPEFGKYDYWAIRWGYQPVTGAASFEEETAITKGWITDSLKAAPWYRYGKQQLAYQWFDARNQTEDLGDDVLAATAYGIDNLKTVFANFMDWLSPGDPEFEYRTAVYRSIVNQYLRYANHVMMNIGGLYRNETIEGDGWKRFENIPAAKQKACFQYLVKMLEGVDWIEDKAVLGRLPVVGSPAFTLRKSIFGSMVSLPLLCGFSDGVDTKELDYHGCMDMLFDFVWKPTRSGRALTRDQRMYQTEFVRAVMQQGGIPLPPAPDQRRFEGAAGPEDCELVTGTLSYDPVSGFEWLPRALFNNGNISAGDVFAVIYQVHTLLKSRLAGANATDKAHYQLLLSTIEYGTRLQ